MKKNLAFILLAFITAACSSNEEPTPDNNLLHIEALNKYISPKEAGEIAAAFMTSLDDVSIISRSAPDWSVKDVMLLKSNAVSRGSENDTTFYVVDFMEGGYALIAAERDLENKVYVYSPQGEFNVENNPMFDVYVSNALATISEAPKRMKSSSLTTMQRKPMPSNPSAPGQGEEYINGKWYKFYIKNIHNVKNPLLKTEWHQSSPYNIQCPLENGHATLVGCVAIAMGQICSYHCKPDKINNHIYDWETMLSQSKHSSEDEIGINDIAHLLRNIGILVNMNYGIWSSGATIDNALKGFKTMGYSNAQIKSYTIGNVVSSLSISNPVCMFGISPSSNIGHAWVVDGYDVMSTSTEYYDKETGQLYAIYGGTNIYSYLHFNAGQEDSGKNAFYLCGGSGGRSDGKDFSTFGFTSENKIITDIR